MEPVAYTFNSAIYCSESCLPGDVMGEDEGVHALFFEEFDNYPTCANPKCECEIDEVRLTSQGSINERWCPICHKRSDHPLRTFNERLQCVEGINSMLEVMIEQLLEKGGWVPLCVDVDFYTYGGTWLLKGDESPAIIIQLTTCEDSYRSDIESNYCHVIEVYPDMWSTHFKDELFRAAEIRRKFYLDKDDELCIEGFIHKPSGDELTLEDAVLNIYSMVIPYGGGDQMESYLLKKGELIREEFYKMLRKATPKKD